MFPNCYVEDALKDGGAGSASVTGSSAAGTYHGNVWFKLSDAEKKAMQQELDLLRARIKAEAGR